MAKRRVVLIALAVAAAVPLAGCQEPEPNNQAELKAAHDFCVGQHSSVKSVQFLQLEGHGYKVVCRNGAIAE